MSQAGTWAARVFLVVYLTYLLNGGQAGGPEVRQFLLVVGLFTVLLILADLWNKYGPNRKR